jgi:hypothetical protein
VDHGNVVEGDAAHVRLAVSLGAGLVVPARSTASRVCSGFYLELTALQGATGVVFCWTPTGTFHGWHTAPRRQYVITLSGAVEIGLRDPSSGAWRHGYGRRPHGARPYHPHGRPGTPVTATIHMEPSQHARIDRPVWPVRTQDRFLDHRLVCLNTCTETAIDGDYRDISLFLIAIPMCRGARTSRAIPGNGARFCARLVRMRRGAYLRTTAFCLRTARPT